MPKHSDKGKRMSSICIIGLGQIGIPVAQYANKKGLKVFGYDINPDTVKKVNENMKIKASITFEDFPQVDAYIISVTTSQINNNPDMSAVLETCKKISKKIETNTLVSIESTIIPGTCRKIYENIFNSKGNLIHVPHRFWVEEPQDHGVNQVRVIGGVNGESLKAGVKFYKDLLGIPVHELSCVEAAEMCKITENAHRYLQIAFAEELKVICSKLNLNFDEVREGCNTKWNVDIPEARNGIGGHCLPKDINYVISIAKGSLLLENAVNSDKKYREWLTKP
jgi:nucleotide sugar dehydrogenase